jgi:hypothetical protein
MSKFPLEDAKLEFSKWAESKKLSNKILEKHDDDSEIIIDAIQEGILVLDEENNFIQTLQFPKEKLQTLKYKNRVTKGELAASTKGIKTDDLIGNMSICYISCLTGENRNDIRTLDSVDSSLGEHIAAFFLI